MAMVQEERFRSQCEICRLVSLPKKLSLRCREGRTLAWYTAAYFSHTWIEVKTLPTGEELSCVHEDIARWERR